MCFLAARGYVYIDGRAIYPEDDVYSSWALQSLFAQQLGYNLWISYTNALETSEGRAEVATRIRIKVLAAQQHGDEVPDA